MLLLPLLLMLLLVLGRLVLLLLFQSACNHVVGCCDFGMVGGLGVQMGPGMVTDD